MNISTKNEKDKQFVSMAGPSMASGVADVGLRASK